MMNRIFGFPPAMLFVAIQVTPLIRLWIQNVRLLGRLIDPDHAAKSQMAGRCIDRLRHARRRAIALAVVRRTEIRSALHDPSGNADLRGARVVTSLRVTAAGIVQGTAGLLDFPVMLIPVGGPLPDV